MVYFPHLLWIRASWSRENRWNVTANRHCTIIRINTRRDPMAAVTSIILEARGDAILRQKLIDSHEAVAAERRLPVLVTRAASIVLRGRDESNHGIWF